MTAIAASFESETSARRERAPSRSLVHRLALLAVALTITTSGLVMSEPAPVDALTIGLIVLLPVVGLVTINRGLLAYLSLWLVAGAAAILAASLSLDLRATLTHVAVTLYLYAASVVFAAFVAKNPRPHPELILKAWTLAALLAAATAIVGYFDIVPGAYDLFTRYDRASGTFKDPNVLGPFLVVPIVYMVSIALESRLRRMLLPLTIAAFLTLAVFLTFSRGAWMNLALSLTIFGYLSLATTRRADVRLKITGLLTGGVLIAAFVVVAALNSDQVANLLSQRASFEQSYDTGAEGRFGGQEKAVGLIVENPLGIGAQEFTTRHHPEDVHNVYLSMLLNAGWLGGGVYWILVALTLALGFRHALKASETRVLFLVVYASFAANAFEGVIVDTDHWRHFYLLMAIVWGLMCANRSTASPAAQKPPRPRRAPRPVGWRAPHAAYPTRALAQRRRARIVGVAQA
jgi:O-antigen ligase